MVTLRVALLGVGGRSARLEKDACHLSYCVFTSGMLRGWDKRTTVGLLNLVVLASGGACVRPANQPRPDEAKASSTKEHSATNAGSTGSTSSAAASSSGSASTSASTSSSGEPEPRPCGESNPDHGCVMGAPMNWEGPVTLIASPTKAGLERCVPHNESLAELTVAAVSPVGESGVATGLYRGCQILRPGTCSESDEACVFKLAGPSCVFREGDIGCPSAFTVGRLILTASGMLDPQSREPRAFTMCCRGSNTMEL